MSFIIHQDSEGKTKLADAFIADVIQCPCPRCGKENKPFNYTFDDCYGCIGRRYIFCCSNCLIHYTDWGNDWDKSRTHGIRRGCTQNGDHTDEKRKAIKLEQEFWRSIARHF